MLSTVRSGVLWVKALGTDSRDGHHAVTERGLELTRRGGKNARKRAHVALARKTAVLMHRLWVTGELYEPLGYGAKGLMAA